MSLLIGAFTIGAILSLLALGVFVSFRVFEFPDITADGSITLGAAVAATLLVAQVHPVLATAIACAAGAVAGATTGVIHTRFGINKLLSGILVMTALYSVNLHVMGEEQRAAALGADARDDGGKCWDDRPWRARLNLAGWEVSTRDVSVLVLALFAATLAAAILFVFFRTHLGTTMQAAGDNAQMIRALGVNVNTMIVLGLALSNAMAALAGALLAQYQGFADVQMGIGMVVWGLASVIIGEALVGTRQLGFIITGAVMGSVLFRLLVAIALRGGLNPNDLKLITAVFVFVALVLPTMVSRVAGARRGKPSGARA